MGNFEILYNRFWVFNEKLKELSKEMNKWINKNYFLMLINVGKLLNYYKILIET